jgi:hypothetical protein
MKMIHFSQNILSNEENAKIYLTFLEKELNIKVPRSKNKKIALKSKLLWNFIENSWDNTISKNIIRDMFKKSEKYSNGKNALSKLPQLVNEFKNMFGELQWGFSSSQCDQWLQSLNNNYKNVSGIEKDKMAADAIVKNRRLKEINTLRNDYIEYLLFESNDKIIPTLKHNAGVDFFITNSNGVTEKWDQKVSKSVTTEFKNDFGENWKNHAILNPEIVAKYLYSKQDESRFGADNRILVVYLEEDINHSNIENIISNINLDSPIKINFDYIHKGKNIVNYNVECFVILLY